MISSSIKDRLDEYVEFYNRPSFIELDPISIPHKFTELQDREIIGFWTAMLAWGQRITILNKANVLIDLMDNAPYDFIRNHTKTDLKRFQNFKHRTFNATDTLYFIRFFQKFYSQHDSLEDAFLIDGKFISIKESLISFHMTFFDDEFAPDRTRKHVSTPIRNSACKRLNMFLRWMVRKDNKGVDFGVWNRIDMADLMIPLDVHVYRVATEFRLLKRTKTDWKAVEELTNQLRKLNPHDPCVYDFALFGLGVNRNKLSN